MLHWLQDNGRSPREQLSAASLGYVSLDAPERPIPISAMLTFFRALGDSESADIAARVVAASDFTKLGAFGRVLIGAATPRIALRRAACLLRRYTTHELVELAPITGGVRFEAGWSLVLDDDMILMTQQFTAALVRLLCMATPVGEAGIRQIRIAPHPIHGVEHLRPWLGNSLVATPSPTLVIDLDDTVLDAPLCFSDTPDAIPGDWSALIGDGSFSHSVRLLIAAIGVVESPTMASIARAAEMSERSFQRALQAENTNFRSLVDDARRDRTLLMLPASEAPLSNVAHQVGYAAQSSLSRAVRRWTGTAPLALRTNSLRS